MNAQNLADMERRCRVVIAVVARQCGVTDAEILGRRRPARIAWPRELAIYLCSQWLGYMPAHVGALFGGRHRTTVLFSCRAAGDAMQAYPALRTQMEVCVAAYNEVLKQAT